MTWRYPTEDITLYRQRGHTLNIISASFSSSYTPLQTTDHPRFPAGSRSPVKFHVCVSSFDSDYPRTPPHPVELC